MSMSASWSSWNSPSDVCACMMYTLTLTLTLSTANAFQWCRASIWSSKGIKFFFMFFHSTETANNNQIWDVWRIWLFSHLCSYFASVIFMTHGYDMQPWIFRRIRPFEFYGSRKPCSESFQSLSCCRVKVQRANGRRTKLSTSMASTIATNSEKIKTQLLGAMWWLDVSAVYCCHCYG